MNDGKLEDNFVMRKENELLVIDKNGLIRLIKDNTDNKSTKIDSDLTRMIICFYGHMSVKQLNWVLEKVKYVIRHNSKYRKYKGIKDIQFVS
jgi:hypothetical protein